MPLYSLALLRLVVNDGTYWSAGDITALPEIQAKVKAYGESSRPAIALPLTEDVILQTKADRQLSMSLCPMLPEPPDQLIGNVGVGRVLRKCVKLLGIQRQ